MLTFVTAITITTLLGLVMTHIDVNFQKPKEPKMTRKDFQLIADVLKASGTSPMNRCVIKDVAMNFAVELQKTNPRFDVQRFVKACTK